MHSEKGALRVPEDSSRMQDSTLSRDSSLEEAVLLTELVSPIETGTVEIPVYCGPVVCGVPSLCVVTVASQG